MGLEARCHGQCGMESGEGRLQYEGDKILFRGAFKLDVAVKDLKSVTATGDELVLRWGKAMAAFALGAAVAPKWARKILHPPSLLDKLGIKEGLRVGVKGKFDLAFSQELLTRVKASAVRAGQEYDVVLLLAHTPAELDTAPGLVLNLTQAGALWVVYPKGGGAIKEAAVRQIGIDAGLVDNKTCSFNSILTALRWVRPRASRK